MPERFRTWCEALPSPIRKGDGPAHLLLLVARGSPWFDMASPMCPAAWTSFPYGPTGGEISFGPECGRLAPQDSAWLAFRGLLISELRRGAPGELAASDFNRNVSGGYSGRCAGGVGSLSCWAARANSSQGLCIVARRLREPHTDDVELPAPHPIVLAVAHAYSLDNPNFSRQATARREPTLAGGRRLP